jgi:hypothetical protein
MQIFMEEKTYFASSSRSTKEEILNESELLDSQKFFTEIFGAISGIGAVINKNRQIVFANSDFLTQLGINSLEPILGRRTGEVISCLHAGDTPSGCGTSKACKYCGAVNAILESQMTGLKSMKETRISSVIDGKLKDWDLNVTSTPINLAGQVFYILILQDISDEKRRLALERMFFHDLLNSATGLNGLLSILKEGTAPEDERELIELSEEASRGIIDEIMLQRQIRAAENGELKVNIEKVNSIDLLSSALGKISSHVVGQNKLVSIAEGSADVNFETDKVLLQRILMNLLKNALESTPQNGRVMTGIEIVGEKIRFWVKNNEVIPNDVQMQLFQRSFSTKGQSRGIGSYSVKLLTNNYLNGNVSFVSNEHDGTVFTVELNKKWNND